MTPVYDSRDYISRKRAGESVISALSVYGSRAMSIAPSAREFLVLMLNREDYSFFSYTVNEGRFRISSFKEAVPHEISRILSGGLSQDDSVVRWWNCVFYDENGFCSYDTAYDSLEVFEGSNETFGQLLRQLSDTFSRLDLPTRVSHVFLAGELLKNAAVRYIVQQYYASRQLSVLPEIAGDVTIDENRLVTLPDEQLNRMSIEINGSIPFSAFVSSPVLLTLPLDSVNDQMVENYSWNAILSDQEEDFSVEEMHFKNIWLQVECDALQNIFLASRDMKGSRKVIQLK